MKSPVFLHESKSSFVMQDLRLLQKITSVREFQYRSPIDAAALIVRIARCSDVYVWGSSGQACFLSLIFSKLTGKRIFVFVFGSEVSPHERNRLSSAGFMPWLRFKISSIIASNSDLVICPSRYSEKELHEYAKPRESAVIYHAIDTDYFVPGNGNRAVILSVAGDAFERKGIDRFIRLASTLPARQFVLAGSICDDQRVKETKLSNLKLAGRLPLAELLQYYQSSRFYVQLSRHEAFGVSVAEAMACGCVPVVSDSGALPEIVQDGALIVKDGDPEEARAAIEDSWSNFELISVRARKRVKDNFSLAARLADLKMIVR